ncbi:unnamed protein product [Brassica rapa subsp. trilocularis]
MSIKRLNLSSTSPNMSIIAIFSFSHFVLHHSAACLQSLKTIFSGRHGLDRYVWSRNLLPFSDLRRVVVMCL